MVNPADLGRDKKSARLAEIRRDGEIFNRVDVDGDNFLPNVRDEVHNLHIAGDDARDDFLCKIFRAALENVYRNCDEYADNLSADSNFRGVAVDGG